ncbi:hypothetical protein ES703_24047 [subsurface metagenome]
MFDKPFDKIDKSDIESLIANEVVESKQLDYKEKLPGDLRKEKQEFVEDVCSFGNASGGYIILGLRDKRDGKGRKTGTPEYRGLEDVNIDQEKLRLEHIILNGVDPRIPGIRIKSIEGFNNGPIILIKIPQSWSSPHLVKHNNRFYSRTSSGKYPLDVHEIRAAFAVSEAHPESIRRFRADRLAKIVAGETPIELNEGAKMVLHIIPFGAFDTGSKCDLSLIASSDLPLIYSNGWTHRYNFDGLLTHDKLRDVPKAFEYVQLFQNGVIEALDTLIIQASDERRMLSSGYEEELVKALEAYLNVQGKLGVEAPFFVILSLLGVRGYGIGGVRSFYSRRGQDRIDRDTLVIPEVIIEEFECDIPEVMRPMFDSVWNAVGWPRSMNYDDNGKWIGCR